MSLPVKFPTILRSKFVSYIHFYAFFFVNKFFFVLVPISDAGILEVSQIFRLSWVMESPRRNDDLLGLGMSLSEAVAYSASSMS